jgi:type I restriction enzyme S subunit
VTLELDREHRVIDWVGGLPDRWEVHSLGSQLAENRSSNKGMIESRVLSLSYGNVIVKPEEKLRGLVPESFETYQIVEPGDIVIRPTDLQNDQTSLRVGQSKFRGIITSAYICLRPTAALNHRYAAFLLSGYDHMKVFYGFGSGLRQNLDVKHIKHIPVPVPSLDEQELIVRYLDHAELRIAKAIAAKHAVLARLTELKRARVDQGILGSSGTKPIVDGLPFFVPEDWDLAPFWSVAPSVSERGNSSHELLSVYLDRGVIRYSDSSGQVHKPSEDLSAYQLVRPGDLVLNNQQAWRGSLGISQFTGIVSPAYIVCRLNNRFDSVYSNFLFRSQPMVSQFEIASRGVGSIQRQVHKQSLRTVRVPIPPQEEQVRIAGDLVEATRAIDDATASLRSEIALLTEYRTRLISDVVTGKLDVRAEAAKLPGIDPDELVEATAGAGLTAEDDGDDE